ncbi:MAG TPA: hypothetical protein VK499_07145 [Propionibacteriaceae bacterium]|jgi:hypothetical protein|nr:hypothetical protein [Propionibacteriaceae bacterium]
MAEPSTTESQAPPQAGRARRRATRSPTVKLARLSALTGILFAALFVLALVFVYTTPHLSASDADITAFYSSSSTVLVTVGQTLVPLAGIAFLWHAHTTRLLIEFRTPSPSAIPYGLQLVSGILFVVLLFAGTASAGSVALLKDLTNAPLPSVDVARGLLALGYAMIFIYSIRGAGMYALTTTTLLRQAGIMPTWLAIVSYLLALFLLVSTTLHPVVVLIFPTWVVVASLVVFVRAGRMAQPAISERQSA